jgi:hypothetical protein
LQKSSFSPATALEKCLIAVRWCVVDTRKLVGKPQEQGYDEHNNKFPSVVKPRFIKPVGERTKLPKVDAR